MSDELRPQRQPTEEEQARATLKRKAREKELKSRQQWAKVAETWVEFSDIPKNNQKVKRKVYRYTLLENGVIKCSLLSSNNLKKGEATPKDSRNGHYQEVLSRRLEAAEKKAQVK